jgi:hypothetical protein
VFEKEDLEEKTIVKKIREIPTFKTKNMKVILFHPPFHGNAFN